MDKTFLISQQEMIEQHTVIFKKIATDEADDYTTGCLLDYDYF